MRIKFHILLLSLLTVSCSDDDEVLISQCDALAIIDEDDYQNVESTFFEFISAEITQDCLNVVFSAPGCDGSSATMRLIDSGAIKESSPIQRDLKLILDNEELCLAIFTQELSFDLTPLRTSDREIILNLEGQQYSYRY